MDDDATVDVRSHTRVEVKWTMMLRWMCAAIHDGMTRNEHIRGTTAVARSSKKIMTIEMVHAIVM